MARIAIIGAAGRIGGQSLQALRDHDLVAIDTEPVDSDDVEDHQLDITTDDDALSDALAGVDTVVHLAAHADPYETWENVLELNIDGTYRVFEAARDAGASRVVFASSNHVTHMHNIDDVDGPETMIADAEAVTTDDPDGPDSPYGISKVTGEAIGKYFADRFGMEVVNLRIGWYLREEELREYQDEPENVARYARAMFLSGRDCRDVVQGAVESSLPENPLTVNVVSDNRDRYLSITKTMRTLGYRPRDDSAEALTD